MSDSMIDQAFALMCSGGDDSGVIPGADLANNVYGVPLPYFSQRCLFQSSVIPAGKFILLAGIPGSCKTSLALYFSRLFVEQEGMAMAIHTENKWPDTLPAGIMGQSLSRLGVYQSPILQDWMAFFKDLVKDQLGSKEGWNRIPMSIFVDSVNGAKGRESAAIMDKQGAQGRQFSEEARELTTFLPRCGTWLSKTSATAFLLLHLKQGEEKLYAPGGAGKDFYSSITFQIDRASQRGLPTDQNGYVEFRMTCTKNSFGPSSYQGLTYRMGWNWVDGVQSFDFQWPEATTENLYKFLTDSKLALSKKHPLRDVCGDIDKSQGGSRGALYSCSKLGAERLIAKEFGEAVEQNETFKKQLDEACHVIQRKSTKQWFADIDEAAKLAEEAGKKGRKKKEAS